MCPVQGKAFTIAGPAAAANKVFKRLQQSCNEIEMASTTVSVPLLPWQAPWLTDDTTGKAAHAALNTAAKQHSVWWEASEQIAQAAASPSKDCATLLSLCINGHVIKVSCPKCLDRIRFLERLCFVAGKVQLSSSALGRNAYMLTTLLRNTLLTPGCRTAGNLLEFDVAHADCTLANADAGAEEGYHSSVSECNHQCCQLSAMAFWRCCRAYMQGSWSRVSADVSCSSGKTSRGQAGRGQLLDDRCRGAALHKSHSCCWPKLPL